MSEDIEGIALMKRLSLVIGVSEPALKLLLSMVFGFPLAIIYRKFIYGLPKLYNHLFFVISGLAICAFNYGWDIKHSLFAVLGTYGMIKVLGPSKNLKIASFLFNMGYILLGYYFTESETYDIKWTTPHCVLALRLIGLTFDICDTEDFKRGAKIKEMDYYGIEKIPNILELSSYVYFPGSFLVGPQFPYHLFERFVDKEFDQYTGFEVAGLKRFLLGFVYLAGYQFIGLFICSDNYLLTEEYNALSYVKKMFYLGMFGKLSFYKYIAIWLLSEGVAIRYGLTYNGNNNPEKKAEWNALENIKVYLFETATEFDHYVQSFNVNTNKWVARHIFKRLIFLGNKNVSQFLTLGFLAVWHGFHTGYYVTFVFEFVIIHVDRDFKSIVSKNSTLRDFFSTPALQVPLFILLKIYTVVGLGWCIIPFIYLSFDKYWLVFQHVRFVGIVYFIVYAVLVRTVVRLLFPSNIKKDDAVSSNVPKKTE